MILKEPTMFIIDFIKNQQEGWNQKKAQFNIKIMKKEINQQLKEKLQHFQEKVQRKDLDKKVLLSQRSTISLAVILLNLILVYQMLSNLPSR